MRKIGIVFNGRGYGVPERYVFIIAVFAVIGACFLFNSIKKRNRFSQSL
jgi:hypothetical protein